MTPSDVTYWRCLATLHSIGCKHMGYVSAESCIFIPACYIYHNIPLFAYDSLAHGMTTGLRNLYSPYHG